MASKITYTFPATADIPAPLRGKTFTGGVPTMIGHDKVVRFVEIVGGKGVAARVAGKPELEKEVLRYEADLAAEQATQRAQILAAVPGLDELREAQRLASAEQDRYHDQFQAMMEGEDNDGVRPPKPEDAGLAARAAALAAQYPRAALYLKAERRAASAHWADNTGKGRAGRSAMAILAAGGSLEDASDALAERRAVAD